MRVPVLLIPLCLAAGCHSQPVEFGEPFAAGQQPMIRIVPAGGSYIVEALDGQDGAAVELPEHARYLSAGEYYGFRTSAAGQVLAVAGSEEVLVEDLAPSGRRYTWRYVGPPRGWLAGLWSVLGLGAATGGASAALDDDGCDSVMSSYTDDGHRHTKSKDDADKDRGPRFRESVDRKSERIVRESAVSGNPTQKAPRGGSSAGSSGPRSASAGGSGKSGDSGRSASAGSARSGGDSGRASSGGSPGKSSDSGKSGSSDSGKSSGGSPKSDSAKSSDDSGSKGRK